MVAHSREFPSHGSAAAVLFFRHVRTTLATKMSIPIPSRYAPIVASLFRLSYWGA